MTDGRARDRVGGTPPRVSIGIPVYNGARYLEEAVRSLLDQTFRDFELIISDNGSTDETESICRVLSAEDDRIRYIRHDTNRGAAWNFNLVLTEATADYFKWASHDDLHEPTFLARCVETMDALDEGTILCYPKTVEIDAEGRQVADLEDNLNLQSDSPSLRLRKLLREYSLSNPIFGLLRTKAALGTRMLGTYPSSDIVLLAELALSGKFVEIPERLFLRRIHPERSVEANTTPEQVAVWFDPGNHGRRVSPRTRLLAEHAKAVGLASARPLEKLRCWWYLLLYYRWWHVIPGEVKRALLRTRPA